MEKKSYFIGLRKDYKLEIIENFQTNTIELTRVIKMIKTINKYFSFAAADNQVLYTLHYRNKHTIIST